MARIEYPEAVGALVEELRRLPGVGPRSAERMAIWLLQSAKADPLALAAVLEKAKAEVVSCPTCGFFATADRCAICADHSREPILCVADVLPLERSGVFKGRYHCLGGKLSPLDNVTPEDLRIGQLLRRIEAENVPEVILAPGSDVEGEATANYLASLLRGKCHITRIAQGLPAGGGLEHADALTLARAMEGRRDV